MLAGFYTLGSGMLTQQRNLDVLGNNLVNAETPGYHADRLEISAFEKEMLLRRTREGDLEFGTGVPTAIVSDLRSITTGGVIKDTGRSMDVALDGEGYFSIRGTGTQAGQSYLTRSGQFDVDTEGYLFLPGFGRVQGTDNDGIRVGNTNYTISERGVVYDDEGEAVGTLRLSVPGQGGRLVKQRNGMYQAQGGVTQLDENSGTRFVQGSLELSNVNMNEEMTKLIETQRAFQSNSAALQIVDTMNRKVAQIASV